MTKPLIVDRKLKRFWALVEPKDGTLWALDNSFEYGDCWVVDVFTDKRIAERAAAHEKLECDTDLVVVEVEIFARKQ